MKLNRDTLSAPLADHLSVDGDIVTIRLSGGRWIYRIVEWNSPVATCVLEYRGGDRVTA